MKNHTISIILPSKFACGIILRWLNSHYTPCPATERRVDDFNGLFVAGKAMGINMKKVIVVSKTHLDLGFTDMAENIRKKYLDCFIPNAAETARSVNGDKKNFVWTTGSWLIREELKNGSDENKRLLLGALKNGDIVPHALPFTMHTELLDKDTFEYGLSYVDEIDKIRGRKTVSAKMTDVPGHTKSIVPLLYKKGIKLLHIGVNGASAIPDIPECFLWKVGDAEIVVIYSGEYGGAYKNELVDDVLYFDHTLDNHGAGGAEAVMSNLQKIKLKYPGYDVVGGTLDDYAEQIWSVRDKLPVITCEIGDTWIHGSAADPYKSAALRTLIALKTKWLADKSLLENSAEYCALCDNILCLAEHTCGMDVKIALGEYKNYLKKDFNKVRSSDPKYKLIEQSWAEQREYINKAVDSLSPEHKAQAEAELKRLIPHKPFEKLPLVASAGDTFSLGDSRFSVNSFGGVSNLILNGKCAVRENNLPAVTFDSYSQKDYDYWFSHYSRDLDKVGVWAYPDFGKPGIDKISHEYLGGRFDYSLASLSVDKNDDSITALAELRTNRVLCNSLGAPKRVQIKYTLTLNGFSAELLWLDKSPSRLPEATMFHFYPIDGDVAFSKLGSFVSPLDIVKNGAKNISAAEYVKCGDFTIKNFHSPLVSLGHGKILQFDNKTGSLFDGLAFILCDNVWGTNFPLWYGDNAYFAFEIK